MARQIFALCRQFSPRPTLRFIIFGLLLSGVAIGVDSGVSPVPGIDCSTKIACDDLHLDKWDRPTCVAKITTRQRVDPNFSRLYDTEEYFQRLPNGTLANTEDNMVVTRRGCDEFCGSHSFYWDAVPRLTTWIIPVVILLSNIELSPIDKRRFMTVVHAVGDPIDSFWSVLHKMYVWRRLYAIGLSACLPPDNQTASSLWLPHVYRWLRRLRIGAGYDSPHDDSLQYHSPHDRARIIATVLAGFEEISGAMIGSEIHYKMQLKRLGRIGQIAEQSPGAWHEWRQCARELADARTNEFLRTLLAIFVYVFGVVAALYDDVGGGNTSKPGGRIGSAVFLMWLVPLALLSNTVGTFTSRRTCLTIMRGFVKRVVEAIRREDVVRDEEEQRQQQEQGQRTSEDQREGETGQQPIFTLPSPVLGPSTSVETSPRLLPLSPPMKPAHARTTSREHLHPLTDSPSARASTPSSWLRGEFSAAIPRSSPEIDPLSPPSMARPRSDSRPLPGHVRQSPRGHRASSEIDPGDDYYRASGSTDTGTPLLTLSPLHGDSSKAPLLGPSMSARPQFQPPSWDATGSRTPGEPRATGQGDRLVQRQTERQAEIIADDYDVVQLLPDTSWNAYFSWLQPLGAIYTYRPWKIGYRSVSITTHADYRSNWLLFLLATFPVAVSAVGAFIIMWYAVPRGWSCRHTWVLGVTVSWLVSVACTTVLHSRNPFGMSDRALYVLVMLKDGFFSILGLGLVFLSTSGIFNNCYCWSAYMWHRFLPGDWGEEAFVPLSTEQAYGFNAVNIYSHVVFACLGAQLAFFAFVVFLWWDGIYVVRWNEERCRQEWISESSRQIEQDEASYLLFWYRQSEYDEEERVRRQSRTQWDEDRRRRSAGRRSDRIMSQS